MYTVAIAASCAASSSAPQSPTNHEATFHKVADHRTAAGVTAHPGGPSADFSCERNHSEDISWLLTQSPLVSYRCKRAEPCLDASPQGARRGSAPRSCPGGLRGGGVRNSTRRRPRYRQPSLQGMPRPGNGPGASLEGTTL